jgi:hypothetical protein
MLAFERCSHAAAVAEIGVGDDVTAAEGGCANASDKGSNRTRYLFKKRLVPKSADFTDDITGPITLFSTIAVA